MKNAVAIKRRAKRRANLKFILVLTCFGISTQHISFAQNNASVNVSINDPLDPFIVTANRIPTKASDVLADNVYIGSEEIAQAGQTSLVELLQRQKGVTISSNGSAGATASVFLRGTSNSQTLVLIDGVRVDDSINGGANWSAIPITLIDHIEIIFGPQSSLYGADSIGGVIQIFTKEGDGPPKVSASTGYGAYGTSINEASIYGSTQGERKIRYSLSVSQTLSTGYNQIAVNNKYLTPGSRTGYVTDGVTGKVSQVWSKGQDIGVQFLQSRLNNQLQALNGQDFQQQINNSISQLGTYSIYSNNQITDVWKSKLQISQQNGNSTIHTPETNSGYSAYDSNLKQKQTIYTWLNDIKIGQDLLQLLAERRTQSMDGSQLYYGDFSLPPPYPLLNYSANRTFNSAAASYQAKHGRHLANFSLRNDSISGYGTQTTGAAAYGYFFTNAWRVNLNYGTGYRAPTFNDLYYPDYGNKNVQAEKSKNTEAGLHYEYDRHEFHIIAFSNTIHNQISFSTTDCPVGSNLSGGGCAANVASAKITGLSLNGAIPIQNISLKGSFTQQNPNNQSTNSLLIKQARQYGNLAAEYLYLKMTFGAGMTFSGRRYDSDTAAANSAMGGYAIYNLYGNYDFAKDWSLFARWNNTFNKNYQLSYGFIPPASNAFVGVRYAMK
ncbi:MAG: TonB-dependent receptor [Polynucleobacter sp.]|nr:TonB-dependent receptor [Polynucleobacter sp.]